MSKKIRAASAHIYGLPELISQHDLKKYPWIRLYLYNSKGKKELMSVIANDEGLQGFIYVNEDVPELDKDDLVYPAEGFWIAVSRKFPKVVVYHKDKLEIAGAKYMKVRNWDALVSHSDTEMIFDLREDGVPVPRSANNFQITPSLAEPIPGMSYLSVSDAVYIVLRPHTWKGSSNHIYDLGRVVVKIPYSSRRRDDLRFVNVHDLSGSGRVHPHIKDNACFGNVAEQVVSLIQSKDYMTLGLLLDAFVSDVNVDDAWGSDVRNWPYAIGTRKEK